MVSWAEVMTTEISPSFLPTLSQWATGQDLHFGQCSIEQARLSFLDTLACILAGAGEAQTRKAIAAMSATGAPGGVPAIAGGGRFPAPSAALINAVSAHALDFDDYEAAASTHPSAPILAALFALAELRSVTLEQLLTAYLVGYETIARLGEALSYEHYRAGWHATSTLGPLGAAAACSRLIGLDETEFTHAVALALSSSAGLKVQFGSDAKALHAGLAARAGLEASLLAAAGMTANPGALEGPCGALDVYGTAASPGFEGPVRKIGVISAIEEYPVLRKPWPCCAYTHRSIEAALRIAAAPSNRPRRIAAVRIRMPAPFAQVAGIENPQTPSEARFSVGFCVASALLDSDLTPENFTAAALARRDVWDLTANLTLEPYDAGSGLTDMAPAAPDSLSVRYADGSQQTETVAQVRGGSDRPMTETEILAKLRDCGGTPEIIDAILADETEVIFRISEVACFKS